MTMFNWFKKKDKAAPEAKVIPIKPAPVSNDSIVTLRGGIERKKANLQKLRETLNGQLPPDESTGDGQNDFARLAVALQRAKR